MGTARHTGRPGWLEHKRVRVSCARRTLLFSLLSHCALDRIVEGIWFNSRATRPQQCTRLHAWTWPRIAGGASAPGWLAGLLVGVVRGSRTAWRAPHCIARRLQQDPAETGSASQPTTRPVPPAAIICCWERKNQHKHQHQHQHQHLD